MIRKAWTAGGKRLFQDGEKAVLKNSVEAGCASGHSVGSMRSSGTEKGGGSESRSVKRLITTTPFLSSWLADGAGNDCGCTSPTHTS